MNAEEIFDWIETLNNYFEYKETLDDKRVKLGKTKLKGTTLAWWSCLQDERVNDSKWKITSRERMKSRIKTQFMPMDYEVQMFKRLYNLKQRELDVGAYTEEFHKLSLRERKQEDEADKVARYLNGLRENTQDEN